MKLPPRCGELGRKIIKLNKSSYRLKQASDELHKLLTAKLLDDSSEQCLTEILIFRMTNFQDPAEVSVILSYYVDDLMDAGLSLDIVKLSAHLNGSFKINLL